MKLKGSVFLVLCIFLLCFSKTKAQVSCGMPEPSPEDKQKLLDLYNEYAQKNVHSRTITEIVNVPISVNLVHTSVDNAPVFAETHINEIITQLNFYFKNANLQFYLLNGHVNHIYNDKYANIKAADELAFTTQYAVKNAINLYFVKTYTTSDLSLLNGSATLPNLSNGSNRIFICYFDNTSDQFKNLKEKVVPHEFGHYFGLLHTFQDSNGSVEKRELVTRDLGKGANCYQTGDQLCDTHADPFELYPSILQYGCGQTLPSTFVDAHGQPFTPPVSNIMSYQLGCGNVFTPQQYQKMQASLAIRFSPSADYELIRRVPNFISITDFDKKEYCVGTPVIAYYKLAGEFEANNQFVLELSDENGINFTTIDGQFQKDNVTFRLPATLKQSANYRIKITSLRPYVESYISESFAVKTAGKAVLSTNKSVVRAGESVDVYLDLSGVSPYTFELSNGLSVMNGITNFYKFSVSPPTTTTYTIPKVSSACGTITDKNNLTIQVVNQTITVLPTYNKNVCQNDFVILPIAGIKNYSGASPYKIIIYNDNSRFEVVPQLSLSSFFFVLPAGLKEGTTYKLFIDSNTVTDFSNTVEIIVRNAPAAPTVTSPQRYCFNSVVKDLQAVGGNLRWYYGESDITPYNQIIPKTSQTGQFHYFVSQLNEYGCESKRSKIEVEVLQPVTANISGNEVIKLGESARLNLKFTGQAPWKVELSDGKIFESTTDQLTPIVQPEQTSEYTLKKVENVCGSGFVSGVAKVVVLYPLATEQQSDLSREFTIFPNPVERVLSVKSNQLKALTGIELAIKTMDGKLLFTHKLATWLPNEIAEIELPSLPFGSYVLLISAKEKTTTLKFIKN